MELLKEILDVTEKLDSKIGKPLTDKQKQKFPNIKRQRLFIEKDLPVIWVLEDTTKALIAFERIFGKRYDKKNIGYKFLILCGFLQSIFVHQDAIEYLYKKTFAKKRVDFSNSWDRLREMRHLIIGHPVEYNYGESNITTTGIIGLEEISFMVWNIKRDKFEIEKENISRLYEKYQKEALKSLEQINEFIDLDISYQRSD